MTSINSCHHIDHSTECLYEFFLSSLAYRDIVRRIVLQQDVKSKDTWAQRRVSDGSFKEDAFEKDEIIYHINGPRKSSVFSYTLEDEYGKEVRRETASVFSYSLDSSKGSVEGLKKSTHSVFSYTLSVPNTPNVGDEKVPPRRRSFIN